MALDIFLHYKGSQPEAHILARHQKYLLQFPKDHRYAWEIKNPATGGATYEVEEPSAKYPEHYFKIGYFRSEYHENGINDVLDRLGLPNLIDVSR
jgi:hypothetical protein